MSKLNKTLDSIALRDQIRRDNIEAEKLNVRKNVNKEEKLLQLDALNKKVDTITNNAELKSLEEKIVEFEQFFIGGELYPVKKKIESLKLKFKDEEVKAKNSRKKFAFKVGKKPEKASNSGKLAENTAEITKNEVPSVTLLLSTSKQEIISSAGEFSFEDECTEILVQNLHGKPNLPSIVSIPTPVSTIHIESCSNFTINCKVNTSIFVNNVKNAEMYVTCQQLRMHKSENTTIHIDCKSRSIIEDSNKIVFTKYCDETKEENYKNVDDFNWLSKVEKSPNFSFLC